MGGFSSRQEIYLKEIKTVTTDDPGEMFKVCVTCNVILDKSGNPKVVFNPKLGDGERNSNPFVDLQKSLVGEKTFACVSEIYLVSQHNDLGVSISIEIKKLFSMAAFYGFLPFPKDEILNLGGVDETPVTNNTGVMTIEIPPDCDEIFSTAIELYSSPITKKTLLAYAGSDNLFESKKDVVVETTSRSEYDSSNATEKGKEEEGEKEDDNNNNNDIGDALVVESRSNELGFSLFPEDHIFIKALNQYGASLSLSIDQCKKLDENGLWKVPNKMHKTISSYMDRIFFRNRRYTTFNETRMLHVSDKQSRLKLQNELQKEEYKDWTPQVSFTLWVKYIKVSNEDSKTQLRVTKIN